MESQSELVQCLAPFLSEEHNLMVKDLQDKVKDAEEQLRMAKDELGAVWTALERADLRNEAVHDELASKNCALQVVRIRLRRTEIKHAADLKRLRSIKQWAIDNKSKLGKEHLELLELILK